MTDAFEYNDPTTNLSCRVMQQFVPHLNLWLFLKTPVTDGESSPYHDGYCRCSTVSRAPIYNLQSTYLEKLDISI